MDPITTIVIPADVKKSVYIYPYHHDLESMQKIVGGYVQAVEAAGNALTFWLNEEGKIIDQIVNCRATALLWSCDSRWIGKDTLSGDVVLTGLADGEGNSLPVPEEIFNFLFCTSQYKAEFKTGEGTEWATNSMRFDNFWEAMQHAVDLAQRWMLVTEFRVVSA